MNITKTKGNRENKGNPYNKKMVIHGKRCVSIAKYKQTEERNMRVENQETQRDGIEYGSTTNYLKNLSQQYVLNEHRFKPGEAYAYLQFGVVKTVNEDGSFTPEYGRVPTDALVNELYGVYPNVPIINQISNFEINPEAKNSLEVLTQDLEGLLSGKYPDNKFNLGMARMSTFTKLEDFQAERERELAEGVKPGELPVIEKLKAQIGEYYKAACKTIEPLTYMGDLFAVSLDKTWVSGTISRTEENYALIKKKCDNMFRLVDDIMLNEFVSTEKGKVLAAFGKSDKTFRNEFSNYKFKKTPVSNPTKYVSLRPTVMAKLSAVGEPENDDKGRMWQNGGKVYKSESIAVKYIPVVNAQVVAELDFMKFKYTYPSGEVGLSAQTVNITPYEGSLPPYMTMRNYYLDILVAGPRKFRTFQELDFKAGQEIVAEFVEKNGMGLIEGLKADHLETLVDLGIVPEEETVQTTIDTSAIAEQLHGNASQGTIPVPPQGTVPQGAIPVPPQMPQGTAPVPPQVPQGTIPVPPQVPQG